MISLFSKIPAFGIDLSDLSIKIAQVRKEKNDFSLVTLGEKFFSQGLIVNGAIQEEKKIVEIIKKALSEIRGEKIRTNQVVCSLPEEESFIKIIQLPPLKKEEIKEVIKWQIEANFPVRLEDVYFDWQLIESQKAEGKETEEQPVNVCITVTSKKIVDSYLSVFKKARLEPVAFEIESIGVVRSLILNSFSPRPVIILDIGKCGTGLTIFSGETILFTAHIEISSLDFDKAIAKELKIDLKEAEIFKKKFGLISIRKYQLKKQQLKYQLKENFDSKWKIHHLPIVNNISEKKGIDLSEPILMDKVFNALIPILTALAEQVQHCLDYYKEFGKGIKYIPDGTIIKIILCGGGAKLIGLSDFISFSTGIPVELGNPLINISESSSLKKDRLFSPKKFLPYSAVIGLALRGATL